MGEEDGNGQHAPGFGDVLRELAGETGVYYYDRDGRPITIEQYLDLMNEPKPQFMIEDRVGSTIYRTMWLGFDLVDGPMRFTPTDSPRIFGTARIDGAPGDHTVEELQTYLNERDAIIGHGFHVSGAMVAEGTPQSERMAFLARMMRHMNDWTARHPPKPHPEG